MKSHLITSLLVMISACATAQRALIPGDIYKLKYVSQPDISPDKLWAAYVVRSADTVKDKYDENIWKVALAGGDAVQLTYTDEDESTPKWSPDGKWLSFLSGRYGAKDKSQLWVMNTQGGEAKQLTKLKASIADYLWSPDAKYILLVIKDQEVRPDSLKEKPVKPVVVDRYHFKADGEGYLEHRYHHLYRLEVATLKLDTLTSGPHDDTEPEWSPDGKQIAFTSNRTQEPDRNTNTDIWIIDAAPGAKARQLTTWTDYDRSPKWSPDGKSIAYLQSVSPEWDIYDEPQLAVIAASGGKPSLFGEKLDRPVSNPEWNEDGKTVFGLIEDDRRRYIVSFDVATKTFKRITSRDESISMIKPLDANRFIGLVSDPTLPAELYIINADGSLQRRTSHNDWVKSLSLATTHAFDFKNKDGITVGGILYWPAGKPNTQKLPLILWIHGGPVAQDEFTFDMTRQILAAKGYAVAAVNYRGSNGRGYAYARSIFGDWGNKEVVDLLGAVDHLAKSNVIDAQHVAVGGWSYGGILTDYLTATDPRFKAAISGAGSALQISMYGTDQYVQQYEMELGAPWKNQEKWMKVSYPFWKVEKIKTPTLYLVGQNDFNVPAAGSEQMYQALRSLGVPTKLVLYPKQNHGLNIPGYLKDRYERYLEWYLKYLPVPVASIDKK
jgi:dipeptidyl aminopeptidase/acylaminoacyl peptidase